MMTGSQLAVVFSKIYLGGLQVREAEDLKVVEGLVSME